MRAKPVSFALSWVACAWLGGSIATASAAETQMLDCGGFACLSLNLGAGKSLKVLFDSGNARSILDIGQAKALGLALEPYTRDGKVVPGRFSTEISNVTVGDMKLPPLKFVVIDLQKFVDQGQMPPAQGTLAYTAIKDRILTLDYRRHRISISAGASASVPAKTSPAKTDKIGVLTYPTFGQDGPAIVATTGFQVNGQPITVQVDTLYSGTLLIYPTAVDKLGLQAQAGSTKTRRFPVTDGGVDMIEGIAANESFQGRDLLSNAPLYFATPQVHLPDGLFDGTVGVGLFEGHSVTFDFRANQFWIS